MYKILTLRVTPKTLILFNNYLNNQTIIFLEKCIVMVKKLLNPSAMRFLKGLRLL